MMCVWMLTVSCVDIGSVRALPLFAVSGLTVLWSKSMSLVFSLHSSTGLNPVSILMDSFRDSSLLALAMSMSSFSLVGSAMFCSSWR